MFTHTVTTSSEQETTNLAKALTPWVCMGDVVRLQGDLGAGKSVFARGLIEALGHKGAVPSPTFTLVNPYEDTRLPVLHMDAYRLADESEIAVLEPEPYLEHGAVIVEWPEKTGDWFLKPDVLNYYWPTMDNGGVLTVKIEDAGDGKRRLTFEASESWRRRLPRVFPELLRVMNEENRQAFLADQNLEGVALTKASPGDWSNRSYWRFEQGEKSRILLDAPPPLEEIPPIPQLVEWYSAQGLRVPQIYGTDETRGYLIIEDFGVDTVGDLAKRGEDVRVWLRLAVDALAVLANAAPVEIRNTTATDLWLESARFTDHALPLLRGRATLPEERAHFKNLLKPVIDEMLAQPQVTVHWDFHANNFMPLGQPDGLENFGIIDFQDTHVGPLFYDIGSLLVNDRLKLDEATQQELMTRFLSGINYDVTEDEAWRAVRLVAIQRTFKNIGGLSKLYRQRGRQDVLKMLPRFEEMLLWGLADDHFAEIAQWYDAITEKNLLKICAA